MKERGESGPLYCSCCRLEYSCCRCIETTAAGPGTRQVGQRASPSPGHTRQKKHRGTFIPLPPRKLSASPSSLGSAHGELTQAPLTTRSGLLLCGLADPRGRLGHLARPPPLPASLARPRGAHRSVPRGSWEASPLLTLPGGMQAWWLDGCSPHVLALDFTLVICP